MRHPFGRRRFALHFSNRQDFHDKKGWGFGNKRSRETAAARGITNDRLNGEPVKTKGKYMRINYRITFMAAIVVVLTMVSQANAQSQLSAEGGIAASPKVRAQLEERKATLNIAVIATAPAMACPKCKDVLVSVPVKGAKGAQFLAAGGASMQIVSRHLCPGCDTTLSVAGTGKAKYSVATHTCTGCGAEVASCCSLKGSETATVGMDKKIEIAPVK